MNVEIGTEAALFPEKEYINGIFVAVYCGLCQAKTVRDFFSAYVLSTPIFCRRLYFVRAYILPGPIFWRHLYFAGTIHIFCCRLYFNQRLYFLKILYQGNAQFFSHFFSLFLISFNYFSLLLIYFILHYYCACIMTSCLIMFAYVNIMINNLFQPS